MSGDGRVCMSADEDVDIKLTRNRREGVKVSCRNTLDDS